MSTKTNLQSVRLEAMGIDVWRLRGRSNTSAGVNSAGEADEAQTRAAEQQGSVDDGDLINVSPNESGRADSVQVQAEKASSSPEPADAASAAVGDMPRAASYTLRFMTIERC